MQRGHSRQALPTLHCLTRRRATRPSCISEASSFPNLPLLKSVFFGLLIICSNLYLFTCQLHFDPVKPHILYASFRRQSAILSWDLRGDVENPLRVFDQALDAATSAHETATAEKSTMTNQRLRFDVDLTGRCLSIGDQVCLILAVKSWVPIVDFLAQSGRVSFFDVSEEAPPGINCPTYRYHAHNGALHSFISLTVLLARNCISRCYWLSWLSPSPSSIAVCLRVETFLLLV